MEGDRASDQGLSLRQEYSIVKKNEASMKISRAVFAVCLLAAALAAPTFGKEGGLWSDKSIKVGDIKIRYLEAGSGDRVLVFIPGWTMNAEVWREQIPYFAARGFRVIAFDPRSHGMTTKTETGNTYAQQAADLHAFLQELKIEHSYLVGWGTGVSVLLDYVVSPEAMKPEKLVFVDGSPAALKSGDYPGTVTTQQARKLMLSLGEDRAKGTEQYVRSLFRQRPSELVVNEMIKASMRTPLAAAFSLYFDQFTGDRTSSLMHVPVPALVVTNGENRAVGEYMITKIPRATLEVIEGTGSAMFLEKPQSFNQILEKFLGEH